MSLKNQNKKAFEFVEIIALLWSIVMGFLFWKKCRKKVRGNVLLTIINDVIAFAREQTRVMVIVDNSPIDWNK